jgi:ATP-dependent 26S proteasome regulatory subunit
MMGMDQPQLMMFLALLNKNNNANSNNNSDYIVLFITLLALISPFIFTHQNKEYLEKSFLKLINFNNDYVKITYTSHEIPVKSYSNAPITKIIYSEDMRALYHYVEKNKKIKNLYSILEILTICNISHGCSDEEREKNKFSSMPLQDENILLFENVQKNIEIYGNFKINEDNEENNGDKTKTISVKKKTYQATIMIKKNAKDNNFYLSILQDFMKNITEEYRSLFKEKDNKKLYIYVYRNSFSEDGIVRLNFDKHPSEHNKELDTNIFFEGKNDLIKYITPFIYNPNETTNSGEEKYKRLGCTFKAGLFFWGYPGCGKTSTIKAILKYTNRHGIYIDLKKIKTCEELESLFRVNKIHENEYCGKQLCFIMEDCDAAENNILKDRTINDSFTSSSESSSISQNILSPCKDKDTELLSVAKSIEETLKTKDDALNLSCFLNTLDGIIELHGIMVIMTSNHPEKIDSAVLREGRFDFKHEFKKASQGIIKEMLQHNFQLTGAEMDKYVNIYNIKDYVLSPAKIQKICFKHNDVNSCINEIILECQKI